MRTGILWSVICWLDNAVGHANSNKSVAAHLAHTAAEAKAGNPTLVAPLFCGVLRGVARTGNRDWLIIAMNCLGVNWASVDGRLRRREMFRVAQEDCTWAVVFNPPSGLLELSDVDCALVLRGSRWDVWVREGFSAAFWKNTRSGQLTRQALGLSRHSGLIEGSAPGPVADPQ